MSRAKLLSSRVQVAQADLLVQLSCLGSPRSVRSLSVRFVLLPIRPLLTRTASELNRVLSSSWLSAARGSTATSSSYASRQLELKIQTSSVRILTPRTA